MNGTDIGKVIRDACDVTSDYVHIRTDGNLGMAIIAAAVSEHAKAVQSLAEAVQSIRIPTEITVVHKWEKEE